MPLMPPMPCMPDIPDMPSIAFTAGDTAESENTTLATPIIFLRLHIRILFIFQLLVRFDYILMINFENRSNAGRSKTSINPLTTAC
jgi:hypothetical protein